MTDINKNPEPLFDNLKNLKEVHPTVSAYLKAIGLKTAKNDYQKGIEFLQSYSGSSATFNAYRRELERLLQWSWIVPQKSIRDLKRNDIEEFVKFCQKPPRRWIGFVQLTRFIDKEGQRLPNPEWRPFVVSVSKKERYDGKEADKKDFKLSQPAIQALFATLSSFFNYLIQEDYAEINPVMQIRQKSKFIRKHQSKRPIRRLSEIQWQYVINTAEMMATLDPERHERTLFIMSALYGMYLRISELAASDRWQPEMGHFFRDQNENWWFKTVGKGNKERDIAVSNAMLKSLKRYRSFLSLSPLPVPGEKNPLLIKERGQGPIRDTRHIRRIVQTCFDHARESLRDKKLHEEAEQLMSATVHWLRHTGISDDVRTRPREHVRDDAGHSSSAITDHYIDVELRERHRTGRGKQIKPKDTVES